MKLGIAAFLTDRSMPPAALARAVEERGFTSLYLPEHTHLPLRDGEPPGLVDGVRLDDYRRSLDPLVALAMAATVTQTLRLGTGVLLVAQHDPITLAKQIATLDNLSAGRFVLGIGYGWNASEMADHGVDYRQRRQVTREKMLCMEALWSPDEVSEYHGELVDVDACYTWPKPVSQPRPTTMIGAAAGPKTFADIAAFADGWMPIGGAGIAAELPKLRQAFEEAGRDPDTVQIAPFGVVPTEEKLEYYASLGVTEAVLRVPGGSADEMLRVLDGHTKYAAIASGGAG